MAGPLFVAGKSKKCTNPDCSHADKHYHASGVLRLSLPYSTYGLDVLAYIGWRHEKEHRQLVEIQRDLNQRGILINERNVGKLYRQFLALLGGASEKTLRDLEATAKEHGGLMWAIDALQPEGHGTLLYVLYEVLSGTPVSALQSDHPTAEELSEWLKPYQALPHKVLATLSDGEEAIIAALKTCWSGTPHQRCQEHALGNLAEPALKYDAQLRQQLRQDLGGLPAVPEQTETPAPVLGAKSSTEQTPAAAIGQPETAGRPLQDERAVAHSVSERIGAEVCQADDLPTCSCSALASPAVLTPRPAQFPDQVSPQERVKPGALLSPISAGPSEVVPLFCLSNGMSN
jgi:hypothetical protein